MPLSKWHYCPYKNTLVYEQECLLKAKKKSLQITKDQSFYLQDGSKVFYFPEFGKIKSTSAKQTHP